MDVEQKPDLEQYQDWKAPETTGDTTAPTPKVAAEISPRASYLAEKRQVILNKSPDTPPQVLDEAMERWGSIYDHAKSGTVERAQVVIHEQFAAQNEETAQRYRELVEETEAQLKDNPDSRELKEMLAARIQTRDMFIAEAAGRRKLAAEATADIPQPQPETPPTPSEQKTAQPVERQPETESEPQDDRERFLGEKVRDYRAANPEADLYKVAQVRHNWAELYDGRATTVVPQVTGVPEATRPAPEIVDESVQAENLPEESEVTPEVQPAEVIEEPVENVEDDLPEPSVEQAPVDKIIDTQPDAPVEPPIPSPEPEAPIEVPEAEPAEVPGQTAAPVRESEQVNPKEALSNNSHQAVAELQSVLNVMGAIDSRDTPMNREAAGGLRFAGEALNQFANSPDNDSQYLVDALSRLDRVMGTTSLDQRGAGAGPETAQALRHLAGIITEYGHRLSTTVSLAAENEQDEAKKAELQHSYNRFRDKLESQISYLSRKAAMARELNERRF